MSDDKKPTEFQIALALIELKIGARTDTILSSKTVLERLRSLEKTDNKMTHKTVTSRVRGRE